MSVDGLAEYLVRVDLADWGVPGYPLSVVSSGKILLDLVMFCAIPALETSVSPDFGGPVVIGVSVCSVSGAGLSAHSPEVPVEVGYWGRPGL